MFRALGFLSDRQIIGLITHDEYDNDMIDLIRLSLDTCKTDKGIRISTQEEAIDYLIPKMRILKKYSQTDNESALVQKKCI
jgi:DNA-directed RNA polymerase beta subunit